MQALTCWCYTWWCWWTDDPDHVNTFISSFKSISSLKYFCILLQNTWIKYYRVFHLHKTGFLVFSISLYSPSHPCVVLPQQKAFVQTYATGEIPPRARERQQLCFPWPRPPHMPKHEGWERNTSSSLKTDFSHEEFLPKLLMTVLAQLTWHKGVRSWPKL